MIRSSSEEEDSPYEAELNPVSVLWKVKKRMMSMGGK